MHWNWHWPSALGNAAQVLPLLACVALLLAMQSREARRGAAQWLIVAVAAGGIVAASKIAFYGWGTGVHAWNLTTPSGHTVGALVFWPVFLALLVPPAQTGWRRTAIALGVALALLCGMSRWMIHAHPLSEVLAGLAVGGLATLITLHALRDRHLALSRAATIAGLLFALGACSLLQPFALPSERWFAQCGAWLAGRDAPLSRKLWLQEHETPKAREAAK
jgi:membrane-associated phospholipid phosphatase